MDVSCVPLAVTGFGSIGMLLWGATAAAPILLHLWNRRRHDTTEWAAMEFLLAAVRKHSRRIRIEHFVLLLVRTLVLVLLAIALADPYISRQTQLGSVSIEQPSIHTVLVFDTSYSMDYATEGVTRFDRAREVARRIVARGKQGDGFTVVALGEPPRVVIGRPAFDRADIESEIRKLQPMYGGANLAATLDEVLRLTNDARRDYSRLSATRVVILTDLGATTWGKSNRSEIATKLQQLQKESLVAITDVGDDTRENMAITSWQLLDSVPTSTAAVTFQATIHNFGSTDHRGQTVEFLVDDQVVDERVVDVTSQADVTVAFEYRFETARQYRVTARMGRDRLLTDNVRHLITSVRDATNVLLVEGKQNAATNLSLALNPNPSVAGAVRTEVVPDGSLLETDWSQYDAIFLCNIASFAEDEAAQLSQFTQAGGGLVFWLGDRVRPENYDLVLGATAKHPLLPARPSGIRDGDFRFDPRGYEHSIVAPFRGFERAGLISVPVWKHYLLTLYPQHASQVALWIESYPIIVTNQQRHGHVAMVGLPGASAWTSDGSSSDEWSPLAVWPSFPPLVHEVLAYVTKGRDVARTIVVGDPIRGDITVASGFELQKANIIVTNPSGENEKVDALASTGTSRWSYTKTDIPGFYSARTEETVDAEEWFAVNVETQESGLARVSPQSLPDGIVRDVEEHADPTVRLAGTTSGYSLFRVFLAAVIVLLIFELLLVHRLDQGRT